MYRILILAGILALIPVTSTGIIALSPLLIPLLLAGLFFAAVPFFTFYNFVRALEVKELAKNVRSSGYYQLSDQIIKNGRNMSRMNMNEVDFKQSSMEGFNFSESYLKKAVLSGANCKWINLSKSIARKGRFNKTNLMHAQLNKADFTGSSFYYANLKGSNIVEADFRNTNLKGANLKKVTQGKTQWNGAVFNAATQLPFSKDVAFKKGMLYVG